VGDIVRRVVVLAPIEDIQLKVAKLDAAIKVRKTTRHLGASVADPVC
jgi:hypothetical protein